jgi:hypothetical protein
MVGTDSALGWRVAGWVADNAAALKVKYVIFAGQIIDFREPHPVWHPCRDPTSSCAQSHFQHVHLSLLATVTRIGHYDVRGANRKEDMCGSPAPCSPPCSPP